MAEKKYKAPALAKGLEILELLSSSDEALTLSGISERLGRSRSEIFRMVQELESHDYIVKNNQSEGWEITNKLFLIGMQRPRFRSLLDAALPRMRQFSNDTQQSCHLAVLSGSQFVVVARVEAPSPVTFSVHVGYRQSIASGTSGAVLLALQEHSEKMAIVKQLREDGQKVSTASLSEAEQSVRDKGYLIRDSRFIKGVTDLSAPIYKGTRVAACLTSPCLTRLDSDEVKSLPVEDLVRCAREISNLMSPVEWS